MQGCDEQQRKTPEVPYTEGNRAGDLLIFWAIGNRRWFEFSVLAVVSLLAVLVFYHPMSAAS